jgi:hypothetical protein
MITGGGLEVLCHWGLVLPGSQGFGHPGPIWAGIVKIGNGF